MSRGGDPLIRQSAERLADLLTAELHPQQVTEKVVSSLQELQSPTHDLVINYPLQRYYQRTAVHLAAGKGLWQCLEVLLKNGGEIYALFINKSCLKNKRCNTDLPKLVSIT